MIGQKINNYEVRSLLGEGGMGSVYIAEHPVLGRRAAIKVLRHEYAVDSTLVGRFINEARASSAIRHPGIIEVFDVGTLADGVPYLMMELLEGETLGRRIEREGRVKIPDAVDIAAQAAAALAAAHAHGIVHRDLKPENLFLLPDPSQRSHVRVKVLDFGIAKLQRRLSGQSIRTHTGSIMGTPPYMSPEQCRGISSEIDHRTDVYAMGIILYEMLTGAPPFLSEGFGDVLLMHLTQPPRPPREVEPRIPPSLEKLVLHALEKEPERRLADMGELLHGLVGPAARTTVREGVDPNDPQYAETDVIPRLRPGSSSGGRRTTFSSTASQLMGDTERLSARRKRLAFGMVAAGALAVIGVAALSGGRPETPAASAAHPAGSKLSAAAQPPAPAPEPVAPAVPPPAPANPEPATPPADEPPAAPPRATAEADQAPAADPPAASTPRRLNAGKQTRGGRPRKSSGAAAPAVGGLHPSGPRPAAAISEFAPLPDKPASPGPGTAPAPPPAATPPPPAPTRAAVPATNTPAKPKLSTDKW